MKGAVFSIRSLRYSYTLFQPVSSDVRRILSTSSSSFHLCWSSQSSFPSSIHICCRKPFSTNQLFFANSKDGSTASNTSVLATESTSTSTIKEMPSDSKKPEKPMTNWEKFKDMYKKYCVYVIGTMDNALNQAMMDQVALYYMVKSGLDVVSFLAKLGLPEKFIAPLRKSGATAYIAAAYAIYHLISPIRYAVTLGATTLTITYLKRLGYIKPVPSSARVKQFVRDKRENASQRVRVFSNRLKNKSKENGKAE